MKKWHLALFRIKHVAKEVFGALKGAVVRATWPVHSCYYRCLSQGAEEVRSMGARVIWYIGIILEALQG